MSRPPEKAHLYDPTGRFYSVPPEILARHGRDPEEVLWLPAVSTLLDIYEAPHLRNWYGRVGIEQAEMIRDQAGAWGSQAHALIEYIIRGGKIDSWGDTPEPVRQSLRAWTRWMMVTGFKPVHAEMTVYSLKYGYAGTLDTVGQIARTWEMADWKTGKGLFPSPLGFLQLAAYYRAYHETYHDRPRLRGARLVGLNRETGNFTQLLRTPRELQRDFTHFLAAMKLWHYIKSGADVEARDTALREKGATDGKEESEGSEADCRQESDVRSEPVAQAAA